MEYYSALKIKEILQCVKACKNLEDLMISEIKQSQKDKESMIPLHEEHKVVKLTETENRTV